MKKIIWIVCTLLLLTGCGVTQKSTPQEEKSLKKTGELDLKYATQFKVDYYEKGYVHIHIEDGNEYVIVPENEEENTLGLENPIYIHRPCDRIYLAASSAMDLFLELQELDKVIACSTKSTDYAMPEVRFAIDSGAMLYVGKYSAPDYELLLSLGSNLAIESTMIGHSPKIKEQLERINIPVFVERSSYETHPIGRLEWIKLYGVFTGKEAEATSFFEQELLKIRNIENAIPAEENPKKKIAFFSINSNGSVTVRKPGDYVCKMIEIAGGEYALADLLVEEENALSTINIGMEDFYRVANDADILIYNGSIDGGVNSLEELVKKNDLLRDFIAVKENKVWSSGLNMFQESSKIMDTIVELSNIIHGSDNEEVYLKHLD